MTAEDQDAPAVRRVLRAGGFEEDESLIGGVRKCASANGLPSVGTLLRQATAAFQPSSNLALRDDVDAARLATAMRVEEIEVLARMHPVRQLATWLQVRSFFGAHVRADDLSASCRRLSPGALEEAPHDRAIWHLPMIPFCIETGELLRSRCEPCRRNLGWSAAKGLMHCSACGRPVALPPPERVDDATLREARRLVGLLDPRGARKAEAEARLHPDLAALPPGAAFDLGWSLGRLTCGRPVGRREHDGSLPAETRTAVLGAGAQLMAGWPEALPALVRRTLARDATAARRLIAGVRALVDPRRCWPEQHELLARTVPELLGAVRPAMMAMHGGAVDGATGARRLRMAFHLLPRLQRAGAVNVVEAQEGRYVTACYEEASLDRIAAVRNDCMAMESVAERLGISFEGVEQLLEVGLLVEVRGPEIRIMYARRQVSRASFERLVGDLARSARALRAGAPSVAPRRALCSIGGRAKPWGALILAMASGRVRFGLEPLPVVRAGVRQLPLLARARIPLGDVPAIAALPTPTHLGRTRPALTRRDAEEVLNLNPGQMTQVLVQELAGAVREDGRLEAARVLNLAKRRMSPAEAGMRFNASGRRIAERLKEAGVRRLGITGWDRRRSEAVLARDEPAPSASGRLRSPGAPSQHMLRPGSEGVEHREEPQTA